MAAVAVSHCAAPSATAAASVSSSVVKYASPCAPRALLPAPRLGSGVQCGLNAGKRSGSLRLVRGFCGSVEPLRSIALRGHDITPRRTVRTVCSAAAAGASDADAAAALDAGNATEVEDKQAALAKTIQLGCLFGLWYLFNIYFNIYNKQVLKVFPYPITITSLQFLVGAIVVSIMWATGLYKKPEITQAQLVGVLPLAAVHTLGNLFTNMSLGKVAVSFTHTIKALEPFFSVLLSALVLGEAPTLPVVLALLPIVGGVVLASATEASFNWAGFLSAMASNLTFQSRNVLSKKFMVKKDGSLDNINLFSVITILSFFLLLPVTLLTEGVKFTPAFLASKGLNVQQVIVRALIAGLCFHSYQQVSYMILQRVSPVTHSVGNCVKRVIVIVTSVLFFKTPVSLINGVGTGIALAGVFGYSRVKAGKPKQA